MTTTPTSGAADLPEALRSIQRFEVVDCIDDKHVPAVIPKPHGPWVRYEDHIAALAAGQATAAPAQPAAQQGAADGFFLLLPQRPKPEAPAGTVGLDWDAYSGAQMLAFGRDCSDAAIAALRTEQPAPSGATEEVENLRKALAYAAFALHVTPQYMLAQGITLIDGVTVRVSRDGWTVEASVNPHRQPAPDTQQAGERVYAFRRKGLADFCTCDGARYKELSNKPHMFETRIFYTAPQPVEREPLTRGRVKEIVRGAGYDQCGIPDTEREAFINGLRHGEHAHGIKHGGQHGT